MLSSTNGFSAKLIAGFSFILIFFFSCEQKTITKQEKLEISRADSMRKVNPTEAILLYKKIIKDSGSELTLESAYAYKGLGIILMRNENYDSALLLTGKAYKIAKNYNDSLLMANTLSNRSEINYHQKNLKEASNDLNEALFIARKINNKKLLNKIYVNLGLMKNELGDTEEALQMLLEGAVMAEQLDMPLAKGMAYETMGWVYKENGDNNNALASFKTAHKILLQHGNLWEKTRANLNLGLAFFDVGLYDSALIHYAQSEKYGLQAGDSANLLRIKYNKGLINLNNMEFETAETTMKEVLAHSNRKNNIEAASYAYSALAVIYRETNRYKEAISANNNAINIFKNTNNGRALLKALWEHQAIYAKNGKSLAAYNKIVEFISVKDSLQTIENISLINNAKLRYEARLKENQIDNLSELVNLKTQSLRHRTWTVLMLSILILILTGLIIYLHKINKQRYIAYQALQSIYRKANQTNINNKGYLTNELPQATELPGKKMNKLQIIHPGIIAAVDDERNEKLRKLLIEEKIFLNKNLTADMLAELAGMNRKQLATAIRSQFDTNFFQLINKLRVEFAIELMKNPENKMTKIDYIGSDSGFNSRATFYSIFTQHTGLPPALFRNSLFEDENNAQLLKN